MPFTIRKPLTIELPRPQQDAADERKRARLAEETEKFLEEATRRATQKAQQQEGPADFMARAIERAKEIAAERGPTPEPEPPEEEGGGGFLGGLRDVGRGALGVGQDIGRGALGAGRGIVRGIDVGLEAAAPFAGQAAESIVRGLPVVGDVGIGRDFFNIPPAQTGGDILDFRGLPTAAQVGEATEFTFRNPLEAAQREVEFGRRVTEPAGRALGRGIVAGTPALAAADVATQGRLSDIAADIGGVVGPELAVLSNAVPVEAALFAGPKLLFRGARVTSEVLEVLGRVAKGGATIDTLEVAVKSDLAKFADEAAEAVGRFDLPAEQITAETRIPPGVSREAPLTGQQVAELPVGQVELPFPRTRNAQEIAQLAGERRNNLRAVQEGAEAGTNSVDDVLAAEAELAVARQADTVARTADVEDLTKTSFDELIENARKACRG